MLGAPPAFILSQDRTLRSDARRSSRRSHRACSGRPCPAPNPADSDSRKNELTCACCHTSSKFRLLSRRRSHRSQYPVLRVRRGGWARRARNYYMLPKPFLVPECGRTHLLHILPGGRRAPRRKGPGGSPGPSRTAPEDRKCPSLVSDVLLSHGLAPQYHRRSGAERPGSEGDRVGLPRQGR